MNESKRFSAMCVMVSAMCAALAGCGVSLTNTAASTDLAEVKLAGISGKAMGGQQPVSGSVIQLYAANTTTAKGLSSSQISTVVTTGADGSFSITGDYTCPTPGSLMYLTSTGGNPGLGSSVNNPQLALMAVLGRCDSLSSSTYVILNEVTTVGAVAALAPFMADYQHVGADASNAIGLAGAFAGASALVSVANGAVNTSATGIALPTQQLNTLANILSACVNTQGGTVGDGSACTTLLADAGSGTAKETIGAALQLVSSPAANVSTLFGLMGSAPPFQPALSSTPSDFLISTAVTLPGPSSAQTVAYKMAIDAAQRVWVYAPTYSSGGSPSSGSITVYDNNGALLYTIASGSGGLSSPSQLAADANGNVWALNSNSTLSKFSSTGTAVSPSGGYAFPSSLNYSPAGDSAYVTAGMTIDPSGNVWAYGFGTCANDSYVEFSNSGVLLTPFNSSYSSTTCPVGPANTVFQSIASDGSGNIYMDGYYGSGSTADAVFVINGSGTLQSPLAGYSGGGISGNAGTDYFDVYDRAQNQLWVRKSFNGIEAIKSDGTAVSGTSGFSLPYGVSELEGMAVDGSGNLWFGGIPFGGLHELAPSGTILTPSSSTKSGLGSFGQGSGGAGQAGCIAVDAYGNIWVIDDYSQQLYKVYGVATPKTYQ